MESNFQMRDMVFVYTFVYQNIIKEHDDKLTKMCPKKRVHNHLKQRRGIAKPERHDLRLIRAMVGSEGSLLDIFFIHQNLVVAL